MTLKNCHKTPRSINTPLRRIDGKCHRNRRSAGSGLEEFCEALAAAGADAPHSLIVDGGDGAEPSVLQVITFTNNAFGLPQLDLLQGFPFE